MTKEELSRLRIGDRIINTGSGYSYVVTSTLPLVATRTIGATNPEEWVLSTDGLLSDAAATALRLNSKELHSKHVHSKSDNVIVVFVDEDWTLNVRGAIHGSGNAECRPAQFRINQIGLMEPPCGQIDDNDADVAELRDHCEAWLASPSIILDSEGGLSGSAVDLGHKFRQANGRAGVCIDLHLLPKGKS